MERNYSDYEVLGQMADILSIELEDISAHYIEGNLTELDLSHRRLREVPPLIRQLHNLQSLDLSGNDLQAIPSWILSLTRLQNLRLDRNPNLKSPPPEIVARGTPAVLAFLREIQSETQGQQTVTPPSILRYESKLLVVGEGGTGKSSLLRLLRRKKFDANLSTTHGIEVEQYRFSHPNIRSVNITLNTWDFGGQQIYHATHQFFLTLRSLYLVVWNARLGPDQCRLSYWLETIQKLAPDAPVLLVATHIDERSPDLNYNLYKEAYPRLIGNLGVSNKTGMGLTELKTTISDQAARLPLMGQPWPKTWVDLERALLQRTEHYISVELYTQICQRYGVEKSTAISALANYLHDLGKILYFQDDDVLSGIIILKPNWVSKAISRVLSDDMVRSSQGVLRHKELSRIWPTNNRYLHYERYLYPIFLRLMERFEFSYQIENDIPGKESRHSLIPQ